MAICQFVGKLRENSDMDEQAIISRIKYLMGELRLRQNAFASRIGSDVSNFSKQLNGKLPLSESFLNKIVVNLGVSKSWLVKGEGVPFGKAVAPLSVTVPCMEERESASGSPVYDIDVTAGSSSREMLFADDRVVGFVNVPGISADCKIVRVSGDSMSPVINNGDYVALREVRDPSIIFWGQIYVVLLEDYRMVKYLRRHADSSMVVLRSANPSYDDIEVARSAIKDLFFVHNIIHIDTRV